MARYYDLDSLSVSDINVGTVMFPRMERCILLKNIESAPTADVVPKSEVAELHTQIDKLQAKVEKLSKENIELLTSKETDIHISMEKLVKVRTEHPIFKAIEEKVARKIFEEISKASVDWGCYCITTSKSGFLTEDVNRTLAELKNKYGGYNNE